MTPRTSYLSLEGEPDVITPDVAITSSLSNSVISRDTRSYVSLFIFSTSFPQIPISRRTLLTLYNTSTSLSRAQFLRQKRDQRRRSVSGISRNGCGERARGRVRRDVVRRMALRFLDLRRDRRRVDLRACVSPPRHAAASPEPQGRGAGARELQGGRACDGV